MTAPDRRLIPLYDWMADELDRLADEVRGVFHAASPSNHPAGELARNTLLTMASYVSTTKGSGSFDLLAALAFPDLIVDPADWPLLDATDADQTTN